ncbi:alpha/beta hydrolase [Streptomyces sp. NPDC000410]|uniref:alpha/beta hydrolase n=1 Tax=Streptomyces sp. NPDC000410 TaxID=3154254 RepID=UPI003325D00C
MTDRLAPEARPYVDAMSAVFPDVGGTVTDAVEARRILAAAPVPPAPLPPVGAVTDRTVPGPPGAPDVPVRIYEPVSRAASCPTVVFLHGGGFTLCGLDTYERTCRTLCAAAGAVIVSVGYRLAPEARFPAPLQDAYAALRWAAFHVGELGGDPAALVVAGDSSGGTLAAGCALLARERGGPALALQALVYPATDAAMDTGSYRRNARGYYLTAAHLRWFWAQYLGPDGDPLDPLVSPLRARPHGLPPAHIVTAGCDPLCDEGRAYAARLRDAGVRVSEGHFPQMFHGFLSLSGALPDARRALDGLATAIASTAVRDSKICGDQGGCAG